MSRMLVRQMRLRDLEPARQMHAVKHDGNVADHLAIACFTGPDPAGRGSDEQGGAALGQEIALQGLSRPRSCRKMGQGQGKRRPRAGDQRAAA